MTDRNRTAAPELKRQSQIAAAIFGTIVVCALVMTVYSLVSLAEVYAAASASATRLAQMEGRVPPPPAGVIPTRWAPDAPKGSAFLEGDTMTVAGAALLQRVTSAVGRVGGVVLSSQVELQSSAAGRIGLVVSAEIDHAALQGFLHDIEAGMPFLFIDQLLVQAPGTEGGNARMTMTVQGQWRNTR